MRPNDRAYNQTRPVQFERHFSKFSEGSVLISVGDTKVLCTANIEEGVPKFLKGQKVGWLTAEYSMLPGATQERNRREVSKGKPTGRTTEIQRLIGRSLRSIIDFEKLGENTIYVDCDVIQADGGTRTAAITGSMLAVWDALESAQANGLIKEQPIKEWLAAISVGIINQQVLLDLEYSEDVKADVDMNIIMTESGSLIEVQGTAEKEPFSKQQLNEMITISEQGINQIITQLKQEICIAV